MNESVNSAAAKGNVDVDDCRAGELENYNSDYAAEVNTAEKESNRKKKKITTANYKKTVDTLKDRPPLPLSTQLTRGRDPVYSRIATVLSSA